MRQRTVAELEQFLEHLGCSPKDAGTVELLVARPEPGMRTVLQRAVLDRQVGLVGDSWSTRTHKAPHPDKQVTLMNARMIRLLASSPDEQALAGDQLYVDLDLSLENLPAGSLLEVGTAVVEITNPAHTGCVKFVRHFGEEAMRFVNGREGRRMRLRGANARVVTAGVVQVGDRATAARVAALF
jgi:MOSC domain-containing protein YiiM